MSDTTQFQRLVNAETERLNMQSDISRLRLDLEASRRAFQNECAAHRETKASLLNALAVIDKATRDRLITEQKLEAAKEANEQLQSDVNRLVRQTNQIQMERRTGGCR